MLQRYCNLIVPHSCFLERGVVGPRLKILYKFRKEVSDGDRSQKTCEVGVFGDIMFVVGEAVRRLYSLVEL